MVVSSGCGMPGRRAMPGSEMSRPAAAVRRLCGWRFECGFDLLLELVEAHAERFASFGRRGFEPGIGDELQTALLAAEPMEAEGLRVVLCRGGADLVGEDREGGVKGGVIVRRQVGDRRGHGENPDYMTTLEGG